MARARTLKPGFFRNEDLAACDPLARLLFAGLWQVADRDGRLEDRPRRIKADILPYDDDCDVGALLDQLATRGFILRYEVGGERFIAILKFSLHQKPHPKEPKSCIPPALGTPPQLRIVEPPAQPELALRQPIESVAVSESRENSRQAVEIPNPTAPLIPLPFPISPLPTTGAKAEAHTGPPPRPPSPAAGSGEEKFRGGDSGFSGRGGPQRHSADWAAAEKRLEYAAAKILPHLPGEGTALPWRILDAAENPEDPYHGEAVHEMLKAARAAGVGWVSPERRAAAAPEPLRAVS